MASGLTQHLQERLKQKDDNNVDDDDNDDDDDDNELSIQN